MKDVPAGRTQFGSGHLVAPKIDRLDFRSWTVPRTEQPRQPAPSSQRGPTARFVEGGTMHTNHLARTLVVSLAFASVALGATRNVPGDFPTIQAAINASVNGDTVLVAPGTYAASINFLGKAITVTSS